MIKTCVAGATGWVGAPLVEAIRNSQDLELAAAVARGAAGKMLGEVEIVGSVADALKTPFDVFVDYTTAQAVKGNVLAAVAAKRHVVIGSSGLGDDDYAEIDAAAKASDVGVIAVGNFAISAALMQRFAVEAAKYLRSWEIIDFAHDSKIDAPSGTARQLAWALGQNTPEMAVPLDATVGPREARGATVTTSQIHSVRLPGYTIGLEVHFGAEDERLMIRYEGGTGAAPYLKGTLLAIRKVAQFRGVVRGLDELL